MISISYAVLQLIDLRVFAPNRSFVGFNAMKLAVNTVDCFLYYETYKQVRSSPGNGLTALGSATNLPQGRTTNNYQVQDTVTRIYGNHAIRAGIDYLRQISTQIAPANMVALSHMLPMEIFNLWQILSTILAGAVMHRRR